MAKRRHTLNPAKVKRDARALQRPSRTGEAAARLRLRRPLTAALLGVLTVALLNVSFAPFDAWPLAYVALVPWACGLMLAPTRRLAILLGWLGGLLFWLTSLYWLTWITPVGYFAAAAYLSAYWLAAAVVLRAAMRRHWPMWICLPVVWVALEYAKAFLPPDALCLEFSWFDLALSQYAQTRLIQVADLTGQYGVSFFVAMVNGLLVDVVAARLGVRPGRPGALRRRLLGGGIVTAGLAGALLAYGTWQLGRDTSEPGPAISIVQRAFPISLSGREATQEEILDSHLEGSAQFLRDKPDLVVWPETMLPRGLNREVLDADVARMTGWGLRAMAARFFGPDAWGKGVTDEAVRAFLQPFLDGGTMPDGQEVVGRRPLAVKVTHMARRLNCPILAGGATLHANPRPLFADDAWVVRNGAIWFDPNEQYAPVYAKRHLVPFSEYVPFKHGWTGLYQVLRKCVPPVMEQLDPGPEWTRFELKRPHGTWRLVCPICYEGTFARVCRQMVYEGGRKRADILVNISNDGWFVHRWGSGPYRGSTEHAQHLSHYCFRAVENRVPVVRAVNTGISASIDADGRVVAQVRHGAIRTMIPGTLVLDGARRNDVEYLPGHGPKVLVDRRISWYSRVGDLFAVVVALAAAALTVRLAWKRPERKEGVES